MDRYHHHSMEHLQYFLHRPSPGKPFTDVSGGCWPKGRSANSTWTLRSTHLFVARITRGSACASECHSSATSLWKWPRSPLTFENLRTPNESTWKWIAGALVCNRKNRNARLSVVFLPDSFICLAFQFCSRYLIVHHSLFFAAGASDTVFLSN